MTTCSVYLYSFDNSNNITMHEVHAHKSVQSDTWCLPVAVLSLQSKLLTNKMFIRAKTAKTTAP